MWGAVNSPFLFMVRRGAAAIPSSRAIDGGGPWRECRNETAKTNGVVGQAFTSRVVHLDTEAACPRRKEDRDVSFFILERTPKKRQHDVWTFTLRGPEGAGAMLSTRTRAMKLSIEGSSAEQR